MNPDAFVLSLLAIADLAFLVYLRQRHAYRIQQERMMANLCMAVRRENALNDLYPQRNRPPVWPPLAIEAPSEERDNGYERGHSNRQVMILSRA